MESKIRHAVDGTLILKATNSAQISATETSSKVSINSITRSAYGALAGKYAERSFDVIVHVTALDHTTGDETYSLAFTTWDPTGANPVTQDTQTLTVADIGKTKVFTFNTDTLAANDSDAELFGFVNTLAGTTPLLTYWAYIAPRPSSSSV